MIAEVSFRNFKALRQASLKLGAFNLVIGPNGSGKTSLIQALMRLRTLSRMPVGEGGGEEERLGGEGPEISFQFDTPYEGMEAVVGCATELRCDQLRVESRPGGAGSREDWAGLRERLGGMRSFLFDHEAMSEAAGVKAGAELAANGANLAGVLADWRERCPDVFAAYAAEVARLFPEYDEVETRVVRDGRVELRLRLVGEKEWLAAGELSQGTLYALAMLALAYHPEPPTLVAIEEVDRGVHPRLLREVRDVLYRLSHPEANGVERRPVQVVATTHSPYLLDLFRDHPEEVVMAEKTGRAARFTRLADRTDLQALLAEGGTLGELWYAGVLGGVPEER